MEVSMVKSTVLADSNLSLTESSGSKGPKDLAIWLCQSKITQMHKCIIQEWIAQTSLASFGKTCPKDDSNYNELIILESSYSFCLGLPALQLVAICFQFVRHMLQHVV